MEEEMQHIKKELDSRPIPPGYKKLDISEKMDQTLQSAKILGNEITHKIYSFLDNLIEQNTELTQEAREIKAFISSNNKSFLY